MKKIKFLSLILLLGISKSMFAQTPSMEVKSFKLENGFTVILNPDPNAVGVYGAVIVKAGSKNDPADATGMAHYLEHLLFKGTDKLGTTNYLAEKTHIDSIIYYYDLLGKTTDDTERKRIQKLINNQSVQGAKYANPTEFDKLIKSIGGTQLNAFTSNDMTVYHNAFPGSQLEPWLELYAHRFQNPVFRSFQSELEVVYEEKNRGMDSPFNKLFEDAHQKIFSTHPYGTQSTIGTVEHLKNPSLTKMYKYFNDYYVANNMALVLSGNFDMEAAIPVIKEKFSKLRYAPVPEFPSYPQSKFEKKEMLEVRYTPIKIGVLAYKTFGNGHKDELAFDVCSRLLSNQSETGLLNKLQLNGKLLFGESFNLTYNDDGAGAILFGPKIIGQSFEEAEKLVYEAVEKIKNGEFSDTSLRIIKQEMARQFKSELEDERNRAMTLVSLFSQGLSWEDYVNQITETEKITREDVIAMAKKYYIDNHFVLRSSTGFPKKETIEKPGFEPVVTDQKMESNYATEFLQTIKATSNPRILDYSKDAEFHTINGKKIYRTPNPYNDLFTLKIQRQVGSDSIQNLDIAGALFNYFHTKELSVEQVKQQFALLGITYYAYANDNRMTFQFEGEEAQLKAAIPLIKELIEEPVVEEKSLATVLEQIESGRDAELKDPSGLGRMLLEYARFGANSSNLNRPTMKELKALKVKDILNAYQKANTYQTVYHYIGNQSIHEIDAMLSLLKTNSDEKYIPFIDKKTVEINKNIVYLVHDKKAVQSQIYFLINTPPFSGTATEKVNAEAFNNYMSDGFSGLLMQEIREYRSLAYGTGGSYVAPYKKNNPGVFYAYVGCQVDKTNEAVQVLDSILRFMPQKEERIRMIKDGLINSISSNYPNFRDISTRIDMGKQLGYINSPLLEEYPLYQKLTFADIVRFYENNIQKQARVITIYGNLKKINKKKIASFGEIKILKVKDIRN